MKNLEERIDQAGGLIRKAQTVVAFSGAVTSTESGLSDSRSLLRKKRTYPSQKK